MSSRNIKVTLAYDGTDFFGWQSQKSGRTVQDVVEDVLTKIHKHPVRVTAAGRTDSGVHALGQVINFETDIASMDAERFLPAMNSLLPPDVRVLKSREVSPAFHARRGALQREYRYYIYPRQTVPPHMRRHCHPVSFSPDIRRLNAMASCIVGTHDFTSFSALGDKNLSKMRTVSAASFFPEGDFIVFRICGSSFLWRMVRSLVGTLLLLESESAGRERFQEILDRKDRDAAGETAPAQGLFLHKVTYGEENERHIY